MSTIQAPDYTAPEYKVAAFEARNFRSVVFSIAHDLLKDSDLTWSQCLKAAWADYREFGQIEVAFTYEGTEAAIKKASITAQVKELGGIATKTSYARKVKRSGALNVKDVVTRLYPENASRFSNVLRSTGVTPDAAATALGLSSVCALWEAIEMEIAA